MKISIWKLVALGGLAFLLSCGEKTKQQKVEVETAVEKVSEPVYDTDNPKTVLAAVANAHGGWNDLWKKGDVEYTYTYHYPSTGKTDLSLERYIFGSEESYGKYSKHEINNMPNEEGELTQYFDGNKTVLELNGNIVEDAEHLAMADFLRRTNYYWFAMPYKINDKAVTAKYLGTEEYNGTTYDKIEVSYSAEMTGKEQNDVYILLVNPETKLVDRFYFSLPFFGVEEPVIVANYEYEDIDGQLVSTKRTYFMPGPDGNYAEEPGVVQTLTNVKFNNGFTKENLRQ
ncbi:DUF6503 family protein [Flagellimonas flava]|uniref:DUF6503 family protein n=1 Tax=Flagellimonas flava TaxID=570519 RepID=UPI003D65F661